MSYHETAPAYREPSSESLRNYRSACEAYEQGEFEETLRRLSFAFVQDPGYVPLYKLAVLSLQQLGDDHERALFQWALENFDDFEPFFRLGYHFMEKENMRMAVPFLSMAHRLKPDDLDIALEYSLALTGQFQVRLALEVLGKVNYKQDFWATYQFHFCRLLDNQRTGIHRFVNRVRRDLRHVPYPGRRAISYVIKKLDEMHGRLMLLDRPRRRIRDWHFVQYGAAILSTMGEPENVFAGGRYGFHRETMSGIRTVLDRLRRLLVELDRVPNEIVALPDRDSRILAIVLGRLLNRPIYPIQAADPARSGVLIVASDAALLKDTPELEQARDNQTVFACNLHWLGDCEITPDVAGFLTQTFAFPWWEGGYERREDDGSYVPLGPDRRGEDEIAAAILEEELPTGPDFQDEVFAFHDEPPPDPEDDFLHALGFYKRVKDQLKGAAGNSKKNVKRWPFRVESPVPGSYFC